MFQLAATESRVTRPESTTKGAERPSAARDHSRPREGSQGTRSTNCRALLEPSKRWLKTQIINSRSASNTARAKLRGRRGSLESPGSSISTGAIAAGSRQIRLNQGQLPDREDAADRGKFASITQLAYRET